MIVETPPILWNSEDGENNSKCLPAALMSIAICESGVVVAGSQQQQHESSYVLATAGNTNIINLWKLTFLPIVGTTTTTGTAAGNNDINNSSTSSGIFLKPPFMNRPTTPSGASSNTTANGMNGGNISTSTNSTSNAMNLLCSSTKIEYLCCLSRHDGPVNTIQFSLDGLHLATGGENGSLIVWSIPVHKRRNNHGRHFWSTVTNENELLCKIITRGGSSDGICDLSWSNDSKRILFGTIDHAIMCCEDTSYDTNHSKQQYQYQQPATNGSSGDNNHNQSSDVQNPPVPVPSDWRIVYRNAMEHTHYVQGVAYDPLGVYLATMSSDRTVRILQRKIQKKQQKKIFSNSSSTSTIANMNMSKNGTDHSTDAAAAATTTPVDSTTVAGSGTRNNSPVSKSSSLLTSSTSLSSSSNSSMNRITQAPSPAEKLQELLTFSKLELGLKARQLKYRKISTSPPTNTTTNNTESQNSTENNNPTATSSRTWLYTDESTLESFVRRLAWTVDGAFLITPAALWHDRTTTPLSSMSSSSSNGAVQYATLMFARHKYDEPYRILTGLEKPSIAVRPNPVLFHLPTVEETTTSRNDEKENKSPNRKRATTTTPPLSLLPYRSIFAVLTWDSVLIYDTYHVNPLSIIRGIHYANLVDATWSPDGHNLLVCSTDGYVTIIRFAPGELGRVYSVEKTTMTPVAGSISKQVQQQPSLGSITKESNQQQQFGNRTPPSTQSNDNNGSTNNNAMNVTPDGFIAKMQEKDEEQQQQKVVISKQQQKVLFTLPPCEPGPANTVVGPPTKRAKVRITPTVVTTTTNTKQTPTWDPVMSNHKTTIMTALGVVQSNNRNDLSEHREETGQLEEKLNGNDDADLIVSHPSNNKRPALTEFPTDEVHKLSLVDGMVVQQTEQNRSENECNKNDNIKDDNNETTATTSCSPVVQAELSPPTKKQKKRIQPILLLSTNTVSADMK